MLLNNLADTLSLDGAWEFSPGYDQSWGTIRVPGCWEAQGYPKSLEGPVIYRKTVTIPVEWTRHRLLLEIDAASYACAVVVNGVEVGDHQGMWAPFAFDITGIARAGKECTVEVFVTKPGRRYPVRQSLAGFLPDLATTFGGLWQDVRIRALRAGLDYVEVRADFASQTVTASAVALLFDRSPHGLEWRVSVETGGEVVAEERIPLDPNSPELEASLPVENPLPWSPEQPNLYTVRVGLWSGAERVVEVQRRAGFRALTSDGERLLLNGRPFLARGVLSWGWNPDRITPFYTLEEAQEEIRRVKALGFNMLKLCLFVPNAAYFQAADEEGLLLWAEYPLWLPEVTPELRAQAPREYAAITRLVREHPSVALISLGCELNRTVDKNLLERLNGIVRDQVSGVLVCDNSGSGESYGGLDFDLSDFTDYHPYFDLHYFEPLLDHWRRDYLPPRPWIFGEFCDADTYRDPAELIAANSGARPWWMDHANPVETFREQAISYASQQERVTTAEPGFEPDKIRRVSYQQALVIRKYTLEALRRRGGISGYAITALRDTPISTSGIWDDLGRAKFSAEDFFAINGPDLLALDVDRRRAWQHGGDRPDPVDLFCHWGGTAARWRVILHCGEEDFPAGGILRWNMDGMTGAGKLWGPEWGKRNIDQITPAGRPVQIGTIECKLPMVDRPTELRLTVKRKLGGVSGEVRQAVNQWPVWVFPPLGKLPAGIGVLDPLGLLRDSGGWIESAPLYGSLGDAVQSCARLLIATHWDEDLRGFVERGGSVILLQQGEGPLPVQRVPFWREAIKLFAPHPLWDGFPHRGFTDLQFFGLASDLAFDSGQLSRVLEGAQVNPILRRLDARDFYMSEYIFEARIGDGTLLATTLRLQGGAGAQPHGPRRNVAGQALLRAMVNVVEREGG